MPGNSFGQLFKITTAGESHGGGIGCIVDDCPPGLELSEKDIQVELDRRRPGQSAITTPRCESDIIKILSGVSEGKTLGTPIMLLALNEDASSADYDNLKSVYRPAHADFTYDAKYGAREHRGGGRSSARETLARVAVGAIAQKFLREKLGIEFISYVSQVGSVNTKIVHSEITHAQVEDSIVRCPDKDASAEMVAEIERARMDGDSLGGIITGVIKNVPVGLGEPVFDKLSADLGKAMLSINAVKGFEIGSGFGGVVLRGSEHNDSFYTDDSGRIRTHTNNAGGTLGGISNGEEIYFRVAFKPTATIAKEQNTVNKNGEEIKISATGRHDPCVLPRAVPIVDAMAALVIMDHHLRQRAQNSDVITRV